MIKYEYNADYCIGQHPTEHTLTNKINPFRTFQKPILCDRICRIQSAVAAFLDTVQTHT